MAEADESIADQICIFEAYHRSGGRTYTKQIDDYSIDVGAYRFAGDMHLPADLIMHALGLPTACYDPTCVDADMHDGEVPWPYKEPLRKIVNFAGRHVGYGEAIKVMLDQMVVAGVQVKFGTELSEVTQGPMGWQLRFRDNSVVESQKVIFNLPRPALEQVVGVKDLFGKRWDALNCSARNFAPHLTEAKATVKAYAVYDDAWWVSRLGILHGVAEDLHDPPASIHYHDGEVLCADGVDPGGSEIWSPARSVSDRSKCKGVLQVFYRHSQLCPSDAPKCMDFWSSLPRSNGSEPLTVTEGEDLLQKVHQKLLSMHASKAKEYNVSLSGIKPPTSLAYSVWAHAGTFPVGDRGLQATPQDVIFKPSLAAACGINSLEEFADMVTGTSSWAGVGVGLHVANNDFFATPSAKWHGPWAEMSLITSERILAAAFGLSRPRWLNETYYANVIDPVASYTPSQSSIVV